MTPGNALLALAVAIGLGLVCGALIIGGSWLTRELPCADCRRTLAGGCSCFSGRASLTKSFAIIAFASFALGAALYLLIAHPGERALRISEQAHPTQNQGEGA